MTLIAIQWFWIALILIQNKAFHYGCLEVLEPVDTDCIGKYLLIEKMAFCQYPSFAFMMLEHFPSQFPLNFLVLPLESDGMESKLI